MGKFWTTDKMGKVDEVAGTTCTKQMEYNLLIKPKHKDFKKVIIGKPKTFNLQADLLN